jgi:hypothetical protein
MWWLGHFYQGTRSLKENNVMKPFAPFAFLIVVIVLLFSSTLFLVGCGSTLDPPNIQGAIAIGWSTQIDPQTNREFRCLSYVGEDGRGGIWCYEINK